VIVFDRVTAIPPTQVHLRNTQLGIAIAHPTGPILPLVETMQTHALER
jgi:hypothetical protein